MPRAPPVIATTLPLIDVVDVMPVTVGTSMARSQDRTARVL
jgi:hypothetical protein